MRLFNRHTQGVSLTEAGSKLLPYARAVADLLRDAEATLSAEGWPPALRLGLTSAVEPAWFRGLPQRIEARRPETSISTFSDTSPRLIRQLRKGRLDAAFIALPTHTEGLDVSELDRLPMMVAMPSAHPLAKRRIIRLTDLAKEPVFWFERSRQPAFYDHCQRIFARHGLALRKLREPTDHHVLLAEVASGRGMALLPRSFAGLRKAGVAYRSLAEGDELSVGIGLATPKDRPTMRDMLAAVARP